MILGVVTGTIVSTIQHPFYRGKKLLVIDRGEPPSYAPTGRYLIAVDTVGAGMGQRVLVLDEGNGARQVTGDPDAPVRSVVVGIVDDAHVVVG